MRRAAARGRGAGRSASNTCGIAVADEPPQRAGSCRAAPGSTSSMARTNRDVASLPGRPVRARRPWPAPAARPRPGRRAPRPPRRPPASTLRTGPTGNGEVQAATRRAGRGPGRANAPPITTAAATSSSCAAGRALACCARCGAGPGRRPRHRAAGPTHDTTRVTKPEPVAADGRADTTSDQDDDVERVHRTAGQAGRSRAWVRKPVWATMRWSGRTDWPSMCQLPVQHLERLGQLERALGERLAQLHGLDDGGRVGHEDAAGVQRPLGVLHDLPRLGQVEHDPVETGQVDALVAVAQLDAVAVDRAPGRGRTRRSSGPAPRSRSRSS